MRADIDADDTDQNDWKSDGVKEDREGLDQEYKSNGHQ
jgi:hypothetical protein